MYTFISSFIQKINSMHKRSVAIGFIGTTLDRNGKGAARWNKWRPTVALCQQPDLSIDRLELIHGKSERDLGLAERLREDVLSVSPHTEVRLHRLALHNPWDFEEMYGALHDFASSYHFDTEHEDYLVHITTGTHVAQICWFLLTEARYLPARLVQTSPARGKEEERDPAGTSTLIDLDLSRYDHIASRFQREQAHSLAFLKAGIATRNVAFNHSIEQIERVALRSTALMLLVGPTGAGKSFLARRIHELKRTRHQLEGRFVEVNCATLRGDGAMSSLFGHIKGAFTGAQNARDGLLRAADGGMLFLDEIGELGADEQAMLLKAIEEKRFFPMGADSEVQSDFQLIAGTHRDLRKQVAEGLFREDLYARINLWTFELPGWPGGAKTSSRTSISNCSATPANRAATCASTLKPSAGTWRSPIHRKHAGPATFASCRPRSRAWRPWPTADASTSPWSVKRSPGCNGPGGCGAHRAVA